jgi:hypothetical protein
VFYLYLCKCDKNGEISVSVGHASSIPQHQLRVRVMRILFLSKTSHKGRPIISHVSRCPKPYDRDTLKKGKSGAYFQPFTSNFLTPSHYKDLNSRVSKPFEISFHYYIFTSVPFRHFLPSTYYFTTFFNLHFTALPTYQYQYTI